MYILYLLFIITNFVVAADRPLTVSSHAAVPPSTPPQPINGRHYRKVSAVFSQASTLSVQTKKDSPLKVSQDDNDDIIDALIDEIIMQDAQNADDELIFPIDDMDL